MIDTKIQEIRKWENIEKKFFIEQFFLSDKFSRVTSVVKTGTGVTHCSLWPRDSDPPAHPPVWASPASASSWLCTEGNSWEDSQPPPCSSSNVVKFKVANDPFLMPWLPLPRSPTILSWPIFLPAELNLAMGCQSSFSGTCECNKSLISMPLQVWLSWLCRREPQRTSTEVICLIYITGDKDKITLNMGRWSLIPPEMLTAFMWLTDGPYWLNCTIWESRPPAGLLLSHFALPYVASSTLIETPPPPLMPTKNTQTGPALTQTVHVLETIYSTPVYLALIHWSDY